jgi:glutamate/tyrosine decarboxylase-like PLP-dependent enzyme
MAGLGRKSINQSARSKDRPWCFDLDKLEQELKRTATLSIVVVNFGEVNTGLYTDNVQQIRALCDKYGAWLHIDGAFGVYLRALADRNVASIYSEFARSVTADLELADSIAGDNHKTLNVPYDSGLFLTRSSELMSSVFQNAGAAYLASNVSSIPSPMNIGIENSRRFRALPVYVTLAVYGKSGYTKFLEQIIGFARNLTAWLSNSRHYTPLAVTEHTACTVVLFRANDQAVNATLKDQINSTRRVYVSPTLWNGEPAIRVAPCNWNTQASDYKQVVGELERIVSEMQ